jgi:signal transduction histidine kinase/CheY-like chemotaxis protein
MNLFARMAIRSRLRALFVLLSGILVTAVLITYAVLENRVIRDRMSDQYAQIAAMTAMSGRAAVAFSDEAFAQRLVAGARSGEGVEAAVIFDAFGTVLAQSASQRSFDAERYRPKLASGSRVTFGQPLLSAVEPVVLEGDIIGHVVVLANYAYLQASRKTLTLLVGVSLLACLICAYLISIPMERLLLGPIARLGAEMASLRREQHYGRRVQHEGNDEVGDLYARFNELLEEVESRDRYIRDEHDRLEDEVRARTRDLTHMNEKLETNIEELEAANAAALAAARAKAEFLANMSHEIRTPMNGVLGMLELVRGTTLDSEQRDCVETAHRSGQGLLTLINDILDLSRIEAGKLSIDRTPCRPSDLVEEVCSVLSQQAAAKGLALVPLLSADCYQVAQMDPARLRQVLLNLVGNAVKFTHEGCVTIEGRMLPGADAQAPQLELGVVDTGIGIDASALGSLFDAFTQADGSTTREYGGTGLGLTISLQLAQLMGGNLSCDSTPGQGSRFLLTLPAPPAALPAEGDPDDRMLSGTAVAVQVADDLQRQSLSGLLEHLGVRISAVPDAPTRIVDRLEPLDRRETQRTLLLADIGQAPAEPGIQLLYRPLKRASLLAALGAPGSAAAVAAPPRPRRTQFPQARVLLAEDNRVNQVVARKTLANFGVTCEVAGNGQEVLDRVATERFDLILMDCQMPRVDGYEATRTIRRREDNTGEPRTPIVALTANAMEGDADRCLAAGMDDYLSKPIESDRLAEALHRWLGDSVAAEAADRPPERGNDERRDNRDRSA